MLQRTLVVLALSLLGACAAPQFQLAASYGELTPKGDVSLVNGGGATANNSLDDLGLDSAEATPALRADFKWGVPHLTLATQSSSWDGNGILSVDFGGIGTGTAVDTELELALHRSVLTFDLVPTDLFELGLGFGVSLIDIKGSVDESAGALSENFDESLPVPVLAARIGGKLWKLDCELLLSGLKVDVDGNSATYLETDLNARYSIFGAPGELGGGIIAGWRQVSLQAAYDDGSDAVDLDLTFSGPYLGVQLGI